MLGLPSAGGNAPEWQLAQAAVTVVCVWFQLLGLKLLVEWQLMQLVEPTGTCPLGLPLTDTPLWQLAQLVEALKLPWSGLAPAQPLVTWQLSQAVTPAWIAEGIDTVAARSAEGDLIAETRVTDLGADVADAGYGDDTGTTGGRIHRKAIVAG